MSHRPSRPSPVTFQLLVTILALAATLGGWALLSHRERERAAGESARMAAPVPTRAPLPTVMPVPEMVVDPSAFAAPLAVPALDLPPIPDLPPPAEPSTGGSGTEAPPT